MTSIKCLGSRLVWALCTSSSLWAMWMRTHYLKGLPLSQASVSDLDSDTWKWICNLRAITLSKMLSIVRNGQNTSLFYDRSILDMPSALITIIDIVKVHLEGSE